MRNIRKYLNEEGDFDLRIPVEVLVILEHGIDKDSGIEHIHFSDDAIATLGELDVMRELYFAGLLPKIKDQTIEGWVKFVRNLIAVRDSISDVDVTLCDSNGNKGYQTDSFGNKLDYRREDISWRPPTTCLCKNKEH